MSWRLRRPPAVRQGVGFKCWAAALESWLAVTPGRPHHTQESLLNWGKWLGERLSLASPAKKGPLTPIFSKTMVTE